MCANDTCDCARARARAIDFNDNFINDSPTHQGCPPTATAVIGGSDDDARHSVTIAVIWPNVRNMIKTNDMY